MSRKDWKNWEDDDDFDDYERVGKMRAPKPKNASKGANLTEKFEKPETDWKDLGFDKWFPARVVEVHKRYAFVAPEETIGKVESRDVHLATIARKFLQAKRQERNFVVVGDRVLCTNVQENESGVTTDIPQCVIQHLSPRRSQIQRKDPHDDRMTHVLASNVDQLIVVASYLHPTVKWGLIDRYLSLAEQQDLKAIVVLNKEDLFEEEAESEFKKICRRRIEVLQQVGYEVFSIQANHAKAKKNKEIIRLGEHLEGKISIFSGHSGVGKSSIVNLFGPELIQVVEPDDDIFYKGRHTTSFASFLKLKNNGYVIDTPGIRSFLIDGSDANDLAMTFKEMQPLVGKCKFGKCRHIDEPGCAILEGVKSGLVAEERYQSFLGIHLGSTGREGRVRDEFE